MMPDTSSIRAYPAFPGHWLSRPSLASGAPGYRVRSASSQSPWHSDQESPSSSASLVPASEGQPGALQSLLRPSQIGAPPGLTEGRPSLQSPPQEVDPSWSWSNPSSTPLLQLSSTPLQISAAPGWTAGFPSLQSTLLRYPSPSASTTASILQVATSLFAPFLAGLMKLVSAMTSQVSV